MALSMRGALARVLITAGVLSIQACGGGGGDTPASSTASGSGAAPVTDAIVATADSFTVVPGASADTLSNDTLANAPASASNVTTSAVGALPSGISLAANGVLSVGASTAAGRYALTYQICQSSALTNCAQAQVSVVVPEVGSLAGRAIDASTGLGIAGITVSAGEAQTTTDASGAFRLPVVVAAERLSVHFRGADYAETTRIASLAASGSVDVQARLLHVAQTAQVDVATGGTVSVSGSAARVVLPANGVQGADGRIPVGNITVRLTPIDPGVDSTLMPGDFTTMTGDVPTPIESFGALNVLLSDEQGATLNLRAGQTATVRIPLGSRNDNPPPTVPLFYFDSTLGRWVQEGQATLAGTGANRYYEGTVSHFSTWNADQVYNTVRILGCVADADGHRIASAQVFGDGIDYSGATTVRTDAAGNFVLPVRRDSFTTLTGYAGGLLTNTVRVESTSEDQTLPACLTLGNTGAGVTMKLTWGARPADLDSHLFAPDGSHVYFSTPGSLGAAPFANLDVDDTSSYGPEVVTLTKLMVGTYKYSVHNYSHYASGAISSSGARVELNIPGRTLDLYVPPVAGETVETDWWNLFELDVDAHCNVTVRRVGTFTSTSPSVTAVPRVYCTPG